MGIYLQETYPEVRYSNLCILGGSETMVCCALSCKQTVVLSRMASFITSISVVLVVRMRRLSIVVTLVGIAAQKKQQQQ